MQNEEKLESQMYRYSNLPEELIIAAVKDAVRHSELQPGQTYLDLYAKTYESYQRMVKKAKAYVEQQQLAARRKMIEEYAKASEDEGIRKAKTEMERLECDLDALFR